MLSCTIADKKTLRLLPLRCSSANSEQGMSLDFVTAERYRTILIECEGSVLYRQSSDKIGVLLYSSAI